MQIHHTIDDWRSARPALGQIVFVPTMGNLHDGHLALMRQARQHGDCVVASIFVNRLQFGAGEDFDRYPRTFAADCDKLRAAGVDHLFAPDDREMYPQPQRYRLLPDAAHTDILEGASRPGHFDGVATVVMKLFAIVGPQVAIFGRKDFQQLMVLRNMVEQFALPITVIAGETVRAADGLALSSRNGYLSETERSEAPRLHALLSHIVQSVQSGDDRFEALTDQATDTLRANGWTPDYLTVRRQADLQQPSNDDRELVVLAAARLGNTRLIDNIAFARER